MNTVQILSLSQATYKLFFKEKENTETQFSSVLNIMNEEEEKLLWKYIDRECTPAEKEKVETMLKNDVTLQEEYDQLLEMHYGFIDYFRLKNQQENSTSENAMKE